MPFKNLVIDSCDAEGGAKIAGRECGTLSHVLGGIDMGWYAAHHKPCYELRVLLKVGTSLVDVAAVQELDEDWRWEQEE